MAVSGLCLSYGAVGLSAVHDSGHIHFFDVCGDKKNLQKLHQALDAILLRHARP